MAENATSGGPEKFKLLYDAMAADEVFSQVVPDNFDSFVDQYKDPNKLKTLYEALKADEVFSQVVPSDINQAMVEYGLGKPSPTPTSASGLGTQKNVGQTEMVSQEPSMPAPSSAPQYLSPEELGAQPQMPTEEVIQTQTVVKPAPTPQQIEPFKDPKVQIALRAELQKKKAQESKDLSESFKGNLLGALYNSAVEGSGKMLEGGAYMLGVMFGGDSEQFGDQTEDERIDAFTERIKEVGIKETVDKLKSEGTTQQFIDKAKEEGGIIAKGVFGLAESAPAMLTPMQVGFLFSTFEDAHKEIRKEMPNASPAAQFLYAATQGSVAMLLEKAGFSNLIQNKSVMKNLTGKIVNEIKSMGVKMTPEVLESTAAKLVNGFLAEAETGGAQYFAEETVKQIADALEGEKDVFEFEGWKNFALNILDASASEGIGGFVMTGLGQAAGSLKSSEAKAKAEQDITQVSDMMNDLSNPNVSPEAKQAISKKVDEKAEAILETYATEQSKIEGLSEEGKREFTFLSDQATSMESVIADPNVSDATKQAVQTDLEETNKKIEAILASAKEAPVTEQPTTNSQVNLDAIKYEIDRERKSLEEDIKFEEDYIAQRKKKGSLGKVKDWFLTEEWFPKKDKFLNSKKENLNLLNNDPKKYFELKLKEQMEWSEKNPDDSNDFLTSYYSGLIDKLNTTSKTKEQSSEKTVDQLRADEQAELAQAIPNIAEYPDTYGDNQGNMPDDLYAVYKPIYDKYDALITPKLEAEKGTETTESQAQQATKPSSQEIADKKADIEKRRQEELNRIKENYGYNISKGESYISGYDNTKGLDTIDTSDYIDGETRENVAEKINAKYDAELAELEGLSQPKVTAESSSKEIADKKAETQRTREDISEEGLQELNQGKFTDSEIEGQNIGSFKKVWGYLRGKYGGNIDLLIDFVANPPDYLLELNKVLAGVKVSKFGKAYSSFIEALEKQVDDINKKLDERVNKGIRENYPKAAMDKLIAERDKKKSENNKVLEEAKKLSDKYDAEIAAKESQTQPKTPTPSIEAQVAEIKSKPLTRIEGAGMGANQAVGTFVSTEPENRYAAQFPDEEVQSMEVDIENPFVTEDTNLIDYRNEMINRRKGELDETDFTEVEIPSGEFTIDDLSDSGIEKVAAMVTEEMKAKGYDSVYFPQTDTQEGELVVFDREKVRRKGEAMPAAEGQTQQTPVAPAKSKPNIILSGAAGGFKSVSENAFDLRTLDGIRESINENVSFAKIFEYKGKKYVGVGLVLSMDSQRGNPNGRNNYSFAVAELNESTPSDIVQTLENSARENFKNIYRDFSENDSVSPIENIDAELSNLNQPTAETKTQQANPLADIESTRKALESIDKKEVEVIANLAGETLNKKKARIDLENNSAITSYGKQIRFRISKSTDPEIEQDFLTITAVDNNGNKVGYSKFIDNGKNNLEGSEVEVPSKYQKQGIASAIYSFADAKGYNISESVLQTPEGRALWKSLNAKQGSIESVSEAYHKAKADGSNPKLVQAVEELLTPQKNATQARPETVTEWESEGIKMLEKNGPSTLKEWLTNQTLLGNLFKVRDVFNKAGAKFPQTEKEFDAEIKKVGDIDKFFDLVFSNVYDFFLGNSNYNPREFANKNNSEIQKSISELKDLKKDPAANVDEAARYSRYKKITEKNAKTISRTDRSDRIGDYYFSTGGSITIKTPERLVSDYVDSKIKDLEKNIIPEANIRADEKRIENLKAKQTPQQDAAKTREIQQSDSGKRPRTAQQQQGQQENRANQEGNVAQGENISSGGNRVEEGGTQQQVGERQLTPEQQTRVATREFLSDVSDWNKLGRKEKRSDSARKEAERLKAEAKSVGLTLETKAIKSGLRLVATNADGQVMTVDKVNKVMNPKRVTWNNGTYAAQTTQDVNGNPIVEFYDAKTGDQIRSNSKEGTKAKEAYYEGSIQKFLGKDKPVDVDALLDYYGMDEDGFNKAVLEAVAESDNAFDIAANYQNFVNHDKELTESSFDPDYELGNLVGQISEADFKKYFDKNWLNKNSKWISEDAKRLPLDVRIQQWTSEGVNADTPYLQSLESAEESDIINAISDLVQAYPDGPQSIKPTKEGGLLPLASQRFRQLTGKPLNPVTAYEFNEMFNRYAENQAFGFASKVAWEDLSPQQKQEIIDEQTRPTEDEFFFEGADLENQPELFAENEQDQRGAEELPTEEQREEIEEDGFEMPTDEEMAEKREEIQTDLQKAIQDVKNTFNDLFNSNMGIIYNPKVEARKLYNFHVALVNLAKQAIRSGVTTAADFARLIGKRLDKFTERAFNDAMNDINGQPMIINSVEEMMNAEYQRVAESYQKQYDDAKKLKKSWSKTVIENINKAWFDANYVAKRMLNNAGAFEAVKRKNLLGGVSAKAVNQYKGFKKEVFGGLNKKEKILLNNIIQARTIISIDSRYDANGKPRIKHPGDTNKEAQTIYLGELESSNPKLFNKLTDRANKYFENQRELLDERLKEGRISIDQHQGMIQNDYSPRVFLEYLIDDVESGSGLASGGGKNVGKGDIKSLSDGDVNSLFHNAEWLLATNVLATSRSVFHNRANRSLYDFAKANPNNGFIEIQQPNGINKDTGQPTYSDPKSDQRQIQFFENGVRKSMLVSREFGESWNNNNPLLSPQYANAIRLGSGGTIKRLFATGINPLFALGNFPRDIAHALFFTNAYSPTFPVALAQISGDLVRTAIDAWKPSRGSDKKGRYYKYLEQGGGMDYLSTQGLPFEQQTLLQSSTTDAINALISTVGYINQSSEIWVRLAIREREANKGIAKFAKDNGRMPGKAEREVIEENATEVSRSQMDFSQGGSWAKALDSLIPYLNASLQGLRVSGRYVRENPKVFAYKMAQALAISAAIAAYNMRFKDDYDDLDDEEKNRNIIFMLDLTKTVDGKKRRAYIRIPKNQSSQWIFAMGELMGESMVDGKFRMRNGMSTLETIAPPLNPQNIPLVDALFTYQTGYDRFRDKYVVSPDYKGEAYAEYDPKKTDMLWRDIGELTGMSPDRLKAATGKLTADPDNNMIWTVVTEGYDKLIRSVPKEEQESVNDMAVESIEELLAPVQRKFLGYSNPNSKAKSIRELAEKEETKIKLQNDTVKTFVRKYINDEVSEAEVRSDFNQWLATQPKDSVNVKRLKSRFDNSMRFKDLDNVFYRMTETDIPVVKARILYEAYKGLKTDNEREVLLFQAKSAPNVPKDTKSDFWKEFNRLKANGEK